MLLRDREMKTFFIIKKTKLKKRRGNQHTRKASSWRLEGAEKSKRKRKEVSNRSQGEWARSTTRKGREVGQENTESR